MVDTPLVPADYELILKSKHGCPLCQHPSMRRWDADIWGRQIRYKELAEEIMQESHLIFTSHELIIHSRHLKCVKKSGEITDDALLGMDRKSANMDDTKDVQVLKAKVNILRIELAKLEKSGDVVSGTYMHMLKQMTDLIEKIQRIEGNIKDHGDIVVNVHEQLRKKLEEAEKE